METKAIRQYDTPNYPKKEEVQTKPSLLRKTVFKRWQKLFDFGVSGMLVAGLSLSGCEDDSPSNTNATVISEQADINQDQESSNARSANIQKVTSMVAPIFGHGEGRGSIGCKVIAPPAYLSEGEAFVIIKEELSKHGIKFDKEKVVLNDVMIDPDNNQFSNGSKEPQSLAMDLHDSNKEIYIEYISEKDHRHFNNIQKLSTVEDINTKQIAIEIRNKLQIDSRQGTYAVFYDPISRINYQDMDENLPHEKRIELAKQSAMNSSKQSLRNQVHDFAAWLKEQGEI